MKYEVNGLKGYIRSITVLVIVALACGASALIAPAQTPDKISVNAEGIVHVPAQDVPVSRFLSPEGRKYMADHLKAMASPGQYQKDSAGYLERQRVLYPVNREDTQVGGVHAYVYTPKAGIDSKNKNRVLINLHGGGFSGCWPSCAELESIPISGLGKIKVVSVDYRQGPKYKHPAASEDVASVYSELLKTYRPQNVGIYGCSAGGMLTAMSVAWFQAHNLPQPGAIGIFCAGAGSPTGAGFGGDAAYTSSPLGELRMPSSGPGPSRGRGPGYLDDAKPDDPLVSPIASPQVLAKFPPTLLVTGTRGMEMSSAVYTHTQLLKAGVDARIAVWEGLFHGFFYNPDVPESKDCYDVVVKYFDRQLGK